MSRDISRFNSDFERFRSQVSGIQLARPPNG
jgi:hypothetical protein